MNKRFVFILIIFPLIFSGCKRERRTTTQNSSVNLSTAKNNIVQQDKSTQFWHQTNKKICVLYGYGYNSQEFTSAMNSVLFQKFGSAENDGFIYPVTFPDDFKKGSKVYITVLTDILQDMELQGIVLLGAPEGTHIAIARMQDDWDGNLPYPVFSLFPQDNVLGMEDSSDFVLDKAQKAEINGILEEEDQSYVQEIPELLENSVRYISYCDAPAEKNAKLFEIVKKICGNLKVERYSDPDTGLISINHFVLE